MECHPRGAYQKQLDSYYFVAAGCTVTLFPLSKLKSMEIPDIQYIVNMNRKSTCNLQFLYQPSIYNKLKKFTKITQNMDIVVCSFLKESHTFC